MNIRVYDRKKKLYFQEKVSGEKFLDFLYDNRCGILLREALVKRKIFQRIAGYYCDSPISKRNIESFIEKHNIDMNESITAHFNFKSFNDFFVRKLKPEARPICMDENAFVSPGDGRLLVFENINSESLIQVKGMEYSLFELIGDSEIASSFEGGTMMILRLNPTDYHRFHFVDSGIPGPSKFIKGFYYSVNPIALKNIPKLYFQNKREWSILKSDHFDDILMMEVGATSVGSIVQTYAPNIKIKKGQEKGYFKFGGSTTILIVKKGLLNIDEDIRKQSSEFIETKVSLGEKIGSKVKQIC